MSLLSKLYSEHIRDSDATEGQEHWQAKMDLCAFLSTDNSVCSFTNGRRTITLLPFTWKGAEAKWSFVPQHVLPEVGWPGAIEVPNVQDYEDKHGHKPSFIFDLGVFHRGKLVGGIEVARSSPIHWDKIRRITDANLWVVEVEAERIDHAINRPSCIDTISLVARKIVTPDCSVSERTAP